VFRSPLALLIPPYGVPLDNRLTHQAGSFTPQAAAYSARYGYVPPYLRTAWRYVARMTDGAIQKRTYMGEVPFRQNTAKVYAQTVVTSPGKTQQAQVTVQQALVLQELRRRGYGR
jgi:hypothetical protein